MKKLFEVAAIVMSVWSQFVVAQETITGYWEGAIAVMGGELKIMVNFKAEGDSLRANIDIPQQGAMGLPLTNVRFSSPKVHFELPAGPGLAVFDGELKDSTISGNFFQAGITGNFTLKRGEQKVEEPTIVEPLPYKEEEVRFHNADVTLTGTLTTPPTAGPHPAVIMITGSGAQNRDEELFGFKPFRMIADHLTRHGIAVLRYDDRGVGGSTGSVSQSTTEDFAGDVLTAVKFLQNRADVDPKQIGLCGHSEGGLVAPLAASRSKDIAFIILMAGTGVTGDKIILAQTELILRADSASDDEIERELQFQKRILEAARRGNRWDDLEADLRQKMQRDLEKMPEQQRNAITDPDKFVTSAVEQQLKMIRSPWFKYFIEYDPSTVLEKVTCPVLALFGGLDLQVPAGMNKEAIESALKKGGNRDYTVKIFPNVNHLFLPARTGSPKEYSTLKKEFAPEFLELMTRWILERVQESK